ncbi:MAG TPA: hypothetical protein VFG10_04910 [Saprospiraceae bacterium]|nr:hypothetical protein [Saprospiraceae bacterium]
MGQMKLLLTLINGLLKTYKITYLVWVCILTTNLLFTLQAQSVDPVLSIRELKEGFLLVRLPSSKGKIDTLQAMVSRAKDDKSRLHLQKMLNTAIEERDSLISDYTHAFRDFYHFSNAAYYFDYEGRDLRKTPMYKMDGSSLPKEEIGMKPVFYLYFERTEESHIDALVIYNVEGLRVPPPFPNNFTRGGINLLFLKIADRKFPAWRVERINKRLFKYWGENRL